MKYRTSWRALRGPAYTYAATVLDVHDGDTIKVRVDLGFVPVLIETSVRLLGCNAIELDAPGGMESRDHLRALALGQSVFLRTVKPDKFGGRYDAQVTLPGDVDLVTTLIADGWAAPWDGKGPKPVPVWPRVPPASVVR
jgi:endonuclease YncB( thermonuclease family)